MDDCRCQNCGNAGRFTVIVTNPRVNGQSCRNACSRLCAGILGERLGHELEGHCGYTAPSTVEVRPMLTPV